VAIISVVGGWLVKKRNEQCPKYRYLYREQPKTFLEEQTEPTSVFKEYRDMFWKPTPWIHDYVESTTTRGVINPFILGDLPTTNLSGSTRESDFFLNSR
jgi:hypothetical protein